LTSLLTIINNKEIVSELLKLLALVLSTPEFSDNLKARNYYILRDTSVFAKLPSAVKNHLMAKFKEELRRNEINSSVLKRAA
jgi:hypothetical protein